MGLFLSLFVNGFVFGLSFEGHQCQSALEVLFKKHQVVSVWQQTAPLRVETELFRAETKNFGTWVELELRQKNPARLRVLNKHYTTQYIFNDGCSYSMVEKKHPQSFRKDDLTDEKLHKIVQSPKGAMIYLWSPRMVYSVKESRVFKQVADQLGLEFFSVVDSSAGKNLLNTFDLKLYPHLKSQKDQSLELLMRGATVHYPSVLISKNKKLSNFPIVGVYKEDLLKAKVYTQMDGLL